MKCRHEWVISYAWVVGQWEAVAVWLGPAYIARVGARRCSDCGAWLPLGPANDGGEHASAVAVELRAAEIAADWRDQNYTPGCDRFDWCPATCTDELCSTCGSLYLAHYHVKDDGP